MCGEEENVMQLLVEEAESLVTVLSSRSGDKRLADPTQDHEHDSTTMTRKGSDSSTTRVVRVQVFKCLAFT